MKIATGTTLGRYRIESPLGEGGMGAVYRAHDTELGRDVALKVIASEATEELVLRLKREARAASALSHPNAATVFDVGEADGRPYIVMELVEGTNLRAWAAEEHGVGEKVEVLRQIARALAAAHDGGLVHRDVKPDNVVVRRDGVAKLLDFGIARSAPATLDPSSPTEPAALGALTKTGTAIGSPAYMAPEQIRGQELDGRADQFAWGVTAFEVFGKRLPWKSTSSILDLAGSILHEEPLDLATLATDVPPTVRSVIERALSKDAADRFGDMRALLAALDVTSQPGADTSSGAAVVRAGASEPARERRPLPWSIIAITGAVLVGGTLLIRDIVKPAPEQPSSSARGPILGLDDEATKRFEEELMRPAADGSATAGTSASAPPRAEAAPLRPCADRTGCAEKNDAWCDAEGKRVACCATGLVATAEGRCACPPGGVTSDELAANGCAKGDPKYTAHIQERVRSRFPQLRACYEAGLERNAKMQGKVTLSFKIAPDGSVYVAELAGSSAPDPAFQDCLVEEILKASFDPPSDGHKAVTYPIDFSPG